MDKKEKEKKRRKYFSGCASEYYLKTGNPILHKEKLKEAHKLIRKEKKEFIEGDDEYKIVFD